MLGRFGKQTKTVKRATNAGFAQACNDGAAMAHGDYLVFLNNDTIPQPGWLDALVRYADVHPQAAIVGAKLVYPNNTIQHAGVVICQDRYPRHIYARFPANHPAVTKSRQFQIVTAACMLVRRAAFKALHGFDLAFRNGFEDVDLCLRAGAADLEVHYCADSLLCHFESVSPGRFANDGSNVALYRERWMARVKPDDLRYYVEDQLLNLSYEGSFPIHCQISPLLATVNGHQRKKELEMVLQERTRQIQDLTRENVRLRLEVGNSARKSEVLEYESLRKRIGEEVELAIPRNASVLVISKGDNRLLELNGRAAAHFPQSASGGYAGYHPANSAEATEHLQELCKQGAEYLLIPKPFDWWLTHYADFAKHLQTHATLVQSRTDTCVTYCLKRIALERPPVHARVVALLAVHNEERFIGNCLRDLIGQGIQVYLIDNDSTDNTVELARPWLDHGLIAIETLARNGSFSLQRILHRKEQLASDLEANWFLQLDADEIHRAPMPGWTLPEAFAAVERAGYNTVNFREFTFVPTAEAPDHDHADYQRTMRWYYAFLPRCPWGVRAWRKQANPVDLASSGGHRLRFSGQALFPEHFLMKHYQFLSVDHALKKYGARRYDAGELAMGMHGGRDGWRNRFGPDELLNLPARAELLEWRQDHVLDGRQPWSVHHLERAAQPLQSRGCLAQMEITR
jgi:GT2 family glycosyltransferase